MLQVEWLKLRRYRPFWGLIALYPLSMVGVLFLLLRLYQLGLSKGPEARALFSSVSPFAFPKVWHTAAYLGSFLHFFPCVLIMLSICNEFQFRTHRQNLMDGWSRAQFFGVKVCLAVLLALFGTASVALTAILAGLSSGSQPSLQGSEFIALFLLQCLVYNSFALLLGFWLQRGLLGLAFFLIYSNILESLLGWMANPLIPRVGYFAPLAVANHMIPFPAFQKAQEVLQPNALQPHTLITLSAIYAVLLVGVSWLWFRKRDL
jgi:ABC-2 type transport system permease protein